MTQGLFSLTGRVALVTGGNGGIGKALALGLKGAGATVVITGRDRAKNRGVEAEFGGADSIIRLDVRDESAVSCAVASVVERFGRLDVLMNNAGNFRAASLLDMSLDDWNVVVDTHLTGSFLCAKYAARAMVQGGEGGKIVNIGSMYSLYGPPGFVNYAAAKTGILGLTRAMAVELGVHGIQVNAILPGWYETDITQGVPATERGERVRRKTPAGRWGEPGDLVGAAVFLAGSASDFVTGVALPVDGGYAIADRLLPE
ncbi:SDR family NAD(P)-dependent oxidoreductase [Wenjunlia tyrosinilytica]|uniref:2-deoxy-D-gluconate 3-dehydrogenase n=1 Tax=Wenjunlia tyrosinilytica TaxID=1544741 RepID=A0A918DZL9_9ACTN|nr:SDR family oxidoreductase [Wenjunlia tyrosinilytica]GGO94372.1 2-deoxy-D-gluconate 3-dehydrogenase [Wenjunlia tyrosinilytica]